MPVHEFLTLSLDHVRGKLMSFYGELLNLRSRKYSIIMKNRENLDSQIMSFYCSPCSKQNLENHEQMNWDDKKFVSSSCIPPLGHDYPLLLPKQYNIGA